jgi:hypothetical protein
MLRMQAIGKDLEFIGPSFYRYHIGCRPRDQKVIEIAGQQTRTHSIPLGVG